jgi:hypothetical protein
MLNENHGGVGQWQVQYEDLLRRLVESYAAYVKSGGIVPTSSSGKADLTTISRAGCQYQVLNPYFRVDSCFASM